MQPDKEGAAGLARPCAWKVRGCVSLEGKVLRRTRGTTKRQVRSKQTMVGTGRGGMRWMKTKSRRQTRMKTNKSDRKRVKRGPSYEFTVKGPQRMRDQDSLGWFLGLWSGPPAWLAPARLVHIERPRALAGASRPFRFFFLFASFLPSFLLRRRARDPLAMPTSRQSRRHRLPITGGLSLIP